MRSYDKIPENEDILLDLPFYEGVETITRDQAKPHHQNVLLINPVWGIMVPSGIGVLVFNGSLSGRYLELANAACVDLDFIGGDYSIAAWIDWYDTGTSLNIMGRYELNVSGWEHYLWRGGGPIDYLTTRHHHAGTLVAGNPRSGCYSVGWTPGPGVWWFMGISRTGGGEAQLYRNGIAVPMFTGGLVDPETSAQDLVIGARYTKNADYYNGHMWRPRIWNRVLSADEWLQIFERERDWFGV